MNKMYEIWNNIYDIKNIKIRGNALSARYSGFWMNDYKIMLDAGIPSMFQPNFIFISHCHSDHIDKLHCLLMDMDEDATIFVPKGTKKFVQDLLNAHLRLSSLNPELVFECNIVEVEDGDKLDIVSNNKKLCVNVFKTYHIVPSVGYSVSEYRNKLKDEFKGMDKKEFKKLRESGVEITHEVLIPIFAYTGDTTNQVFDNDKINWNDHKFIITETTYINELTEDAIELSETNQHNNIGNIEQVASKYPDTTFAVCHWSARYSRDDLIEYFKRKNYKNIVPLISN